MTALVLSGGGLWATAAIGVIRALEELNISIDMIVGTSGGAVVGGLYSAGLSPDELRNLAISLSRRDFPVNLRKMGREMVGHRRWPDSLIDVTPFWRKVAPFIRHRRFSALNPPLWIVATSLTNRSLSVFGSPVSDYAVPVQGMGEPIQDVGVELAIRASFAVPGVFSPVVFKNQWLVDGGVGDDYPVDIAASVGAERIIGVWIDEPSRLKSGPMARADFVQVLMESMAVMIHEMSLLRQLGVIVPRVDIRFEMKSGMWAFSQIPEIIEHGYHRTMGLRDQLQALVSD